MESQIGIKEGQAMGMGGRQGPSQKKKLLTSDKRTLNFNLKGWETTEGF